MELTVKKGDLMPLRTLPSEVLKGKIIEDLMPWITQLLSIKPTDENVLKLEALFPIIEQTAWSMNFKQIKEAFLKYVKGELAGLEPRDNYLTLILFGQVIRAYKEQRKPEVVALSEKERNPEEEKQTAIDNIFLAYADFKETGQVTDNYWPVFETLHQEGVIQTGPKYEAYFLDMKKRARLMIHIPLLQKLERVKRADLADVPKGQELAEQVEATKDLEHPEILKKSMCLVVQSLFKTYSEDQLRKKLNIQ